MCYDMQTADVVQKGTGHSGRGHYVGYFLNKVTGLHKPCIGTDIVLFTVIFTLSMFPPPSPVDFP